MKPNEISELIEDVVSNEVRKKILKEAKESKKEVYHIMCDGEPVANFETQDEAESHLDIYKKDNPGKQFIIEKGIYESYEDMIEKLDEMGQQLEEKENQNMENQEPMEGNAFSYALSKAKESGDETFTVDGKEYNVEECWKQMEEEESQMGEDWNEGECKECGGEMKEEDEEGQDVYSIWKKYSDEACSENSASDFSDEFEYADNVIHHIVQNCIANGDCDEEDEDDLTDEIKDAFGDTLFDMYKSDGGDMGDNSDDDEDYEDDEDDEEGNENDSISVEEGTKMCNECGNMLSEDGTCNECGSGAMYESNTKKLRLTEKELVNLITKMVNESIPGLKTYQDAHKGSGAENKANLSDVEKKIKKSMSFEGNDNPKFPKQIGKGEKVARENTKEQDEEVAKNFAGLENLQYDVEPSEQFKKRLKMAIEGHSSMGNAPTKEVVKTTNGTKIGEQPKEKDGNTIPTPETAKKIEKQVKDREKDKKERVLYSKEKVPVSESKIGLSSLLQEEIQKMKKIETYNKKTQ
jgi:hypothetical protein